MNLVKYTMIFLIASAPLACGGNSPSNNAANTPANVNAHANANRNNAETDVYKDYPGDVGPKNVAAEEKDSKIKAPVPAKLNMAKAEAVKKTQAPSRPSVDSPVAAKFTVVFKRSSTPKKLKKPAVVTADPPVDEP